MGLDAFVPCRCWQDGLTSAPPVPRTAIVMTHDGVDMTLPYEGNEELWHRFDAWMHECCPHEDMEYAAEHIGNWPGYRQFQWALGVVGWERFPVLHRVLPEANGGSVEQVDASRALAELVDFTTCGQIAARAELCDGITGEVIATENPVYGGSFMIGPGYEVGIDATGLHVWDRTAGQEVFRATRVQQRAGDGGAWLADLDHPERGETWLGTTIDGGASRLLIRSRPYDVDDFGYVVDGLTSVFKAAVEIGNPVIWT